VIVFAVDQIAGAEYLLPLLLRWKKTNIFPCITFGSALSVNFLKSKGVDCYLIDNIIERDLDHILKNIRPTLGVFSTSMNSSIERSMRRVFKKMSIQTIQFIDTWANYSSRFMVENGEFDFPNYILTLDEASKKEMANEGVPEEKIYVVGQPYFESRLLDSDEYFTKSCNSDSIILFTQPIYKNFKMGLGYDELSFVNRFMRVWGALGRPWELVTINVHPAENIEVYKLLIQNYSTNIHVTQSQDFLLDSYKIVLGMYSSALIQAFLKGKFVASFQPSGIDKDMCNLSSTGNIPRFIDEVELVDWLKSIANQKHAVNSAKRDQLLSTLIGSNSRLENFISKRLKGSTENEN
jgi:hypothetical protein